MMDKNNYDKMDRKRKKQKQQQQQEPQQQQADLTSRNCKLEEEGGARREVGMAEEDRPAEAAAAAQEAVADEPEMGATAPRASKLQVRTIQVDQDELLRLVRDEAMALPDLNIALSGMAGRFPKSDSISEFEANLRAGRDMVNDNDNSRFTCGLWNLPPRAGRLNDLSRFDYEFFGFSLDHANYIDYQLRILYEVVYESILDAGLNPANLRGSKTGVFFGLHCSEFENEMADNPAFMTNGYYAQFGLKIAQYFDFRGMTLTFDAACASGFVGLHNAVEALRDGTVEQAIVCSSNIPIHPTGSFIFYQMQMLSPTGYSRFLDSRADGYVKSEACVSMLLQRKQLAKRNYASFMATLTSVDGYKPEGITFPSDRSQERLIRAAKELANLSTNHIEYLEAHGTGTPAGDPQEARAISSVYFPSDKKSCSAKTAATTTTTTAQNQQREIITVKDSEIVQSFSNSISDQQQQSAEAEAEVNREERKIGPLLVGSVKTCMGHSEGASGLCALVKVALMLENELIYKNLHFDQPNTNIEALMDGRLKFVDETLPLKSKIIPMSCYGFGGSNVHVICRANERESISAAVASSGSGPTSGSSGQCNTLLTTGGIPRLVLMFGRGEQELNHFFDKLIDVSSTSSTRYCLTDDFLSLLDSISSDKIDRLMNYRGFALIDAKQDEPIGGGGGELARSIKRLDLKPLLRDDELVRGNGDSDLGRRIHLQEHAKRWCHLVLPGLGSQWTGMAHGLSQFKQFWSTIERLHDMLELFQSDINLLKVFQLSQASEEEEEEEEGGSNLNDSQCCAFVSIVAYQIALINLVKNHLKVNNLGSIVGHSLGEISCAYASGLFDERETIMVAYWLGKTIDDNRQLIGGKMVALMGLPWQQLAHLVDEYQQHIATVTTTTTTTTTTTKELEPFTIRVSCINGPNSVTVSGRHEQVDQMYDWLMREHQQVGQQLIVHEVCSQVALHNEFIMNKSNPIRVKFRQALERVLLPLTDYDRTKTRWISSFASEQNESYTSEQDRACVRAQQANVEYFVEMLCTKVNFHSALEQLEPDSIVYELGPTNLFQSQIVQMLDKDGARKFHYVKAMQKWTQADKQIVHLLSSFGELYQAGATFNLTNFYQAQAQSSSSTAGTSGHSGQVFPVRRQTPSLSSLINWSHASTLFVPRYPIQFSKSSAKCEMPIDMVQDRDKYLAGHCIEGRVLYPATGYLFLIWRVFSFTKRKIYDACFQDVESELVPIEFRNVRLLRAVILGQRQVQMYIHYEEATGRFEIKEGGSVVVEGYAHSPQENPSGLLYEEVRSRIRALNAELSMTRDDVYKQFRVSGYDYGDTFQCIQASSYDGTVCKVKFNGHFVCLTDSILQSIFLAIVQYAPQSALFLPTRFEYVRFQPEIILAKMRAAKWSLDSSDGSLNTKAKRELMTKIMQRESATQAATPTTTASANDLEGGVGGVGGNSTGEAGDSLAQVVDVKDERLECIFDTYCDTTTGIIITDGIEMRGIKASPAPRRVDNNEVLLESYQFVADFEEPVQDEQLTRFEEITQTYSNVCNSMSVELLTKLNVQVASSFIKEHQTGRVSRQEIDSYMHDHLACVYDKTSGQEVGSNPEEGVAQSGGGDSSSKEQQQQQQQANYDIKKNGQRVLMSIYDQLLTLHEARDKIDSSQVRKRIQENRTLLMKDLVHNSFTCERFIRPIIETVVENVCTKKLKLRMIEVNTDDGILRTNLQQLIQQIEPQLALDYAIAHPNPNRLHGSVVAIDGGSGAAGSGTNKTHTLRSIETFFQDNHLKDLDLVVYKDKSCYCVEAAGAAAADPGANEVANKQEGERQDDDNDGGADDDDDENGDDDDDDDDESVIRKKSRSLLQSLAQSIQSSGYFLLMMRQELTLAELSLLALSKHNLVAGQEEEQESAAKLISDEIQSINSKLKRRVDILLDEALSLKVTSSGGGNCINCASIQLVVKRTDPAGCLMLLFKRVETAVPAPTRREPRTGSQPKLEPHGDESSSSLNNQASLQGSGSASEQQQIERLVLRVRHDELDWLEQLKRNFSKLAASGEDQSGEQQQQDNAIQDSNGGGGANVEPKQETKQEPKQVWLCAVLTRQCPVSGLIGMMQALRKELGSVHLRCFYDAFTFKDSNEPISVKQIIESKNFNEALRRNQVWFCVNENNQLGSYRHFTINDCLSSENSLCGKQRVRKLLVPAESAAESNSQQVSRAGQRQQQQQLACKYQRGAYVNNSTRGDLSSFTWFEGPFKYLKEASEETQLVRVAYSALNFRDIMLATGRLPLDSLPMGLALADCLLGLEFSGYELATGKRVMGMNYGRGIATHVQCPRENAIKLEIPASLSMAEAATIPVVYTTAILALIYRGQAKRGESCLIHAGSGGVGQAAIRVALHFGLTVYTTVGSQEKRNFLMEEFGVKGLRAGNIFNSRTCEFEDQLFRATRGRGVDLVLNSLADDKLQASLRCLADGGRFLEIGKYDMSVDSQLELARLDTNKTFHGILLDKLFDADQMAGSFKRQLMGVLETLKTGLREGFVAPIKYKCFKHFEVEEAFRYMATGKHIGKVLIEIDGDNCDDTGSGVPLPGSAASLARAQQLQIKCVPRFQLSPVKSFIVTGGLGGFGLELCKWLAHNGARYLVLTSRQGVKSGYQRATLKRLESNLKCRVQIVCESEADASTLEGALKLCELARQMSPDKQLGGVFHLAMVLQDTLLENMTPEAFSEVCKPKLATCVALDEATRLIEQRQAGCELDYFVAFSSITSGKGNAGQANYAYANSALERVCESRRAAARHGLAIQWGAIGDVGVAYENLGGNDVIIGGTIPQRMPSCLATLAKLLCSPFPVCLSVLPVNRNQDSLNERGDLVSAIMHVLGIKDSSKVSEDATLGDLGLDSLMAVEIRQYIEREYDMTLNIQEIRALTIARIREINDTERTQVTAAGGGGGTGGQVKSTTSGGSGLEQTKKIEVASYGVQQKAQVTGNAGGLDANVSATVAAAIRARSASSSSQKSAINGTALLDKNLVAAFVPPLELAKSDYCRLNCISTKPEVASKATGSESRKPIFFLPPITGKFDKLEPICANINRPCIGLNWTRELGQARTVDEAAQIYLKVLKRTNWNDFSAKQNGGEGKDTNQNDADDECKVVDIVGYSFGATIGFELMQAIHSQSPAKGNRKQQQKQQQQLQKKQSDIIDNQLVAGNLILLDGSPKQIELGSQYLASLTSRKPLNLGEKVDELLMIYLVANTRSLAGGSGGGGGGNAFQTTSALEHLSIQRELSRCTEIETKIRFASKKLVELLNRSMATTAAAAAVAAGNNLRLPAVSTTGQSNRLKEVKSFMLNNKSREQQIETIAHAMEAFLRRYELINNYKASTEQKLPSGCTLIRAEQMYLKQATTTAQPAAAAAATSYHQVVQAATVAKAMATIATPNSGNNNSTTSIMTPPDTPEPGKSSTPIIQNGHHQNSDRTTPTTSSSGSSGCSSPRERASSTSSSSSTTYNEDLNLASIVAGSVDLYIMPGDHESFLNKNQAEIGDIIARACSSSAGDGSCISTANQMKQLHSNKTNETAATQLENPNVNSKRSSANGNLLHRTKKAELGV